ncbi:MAG: tetratricopeptide repeat protein [Planctomycetes bacterium]|nr:tetratricopeptide repeat protein [Planctomycetota bacterium]
MTRTKINLKPLIVIFISIVTLAMTTLCLRQWNRNHRAGLGLRDGTEAFENKQWQLAAENLGKYIVIFPDDVSAIMKYAEAQINITPMNAGTINQALNSYRKVLRIDPTHKKAVLSLMNIYMHLMKIPAEAELVATEFLKRRQDSKVRRSLAMSYYQQRKFAEARQELMRIIKDDPAEVTAYALLARLVEKRPQEFTETPQKLYDQAVTGCPANPLAYIVRGEYYLRQSNKSDAVNDFIKAEKLSLSDITVRLRLAEAFFNSSMPEKTRTHLRRAASSDPDNIRIWQLWAKLALRNSSPREMADVARRGCQSLTADLLLFLPIAAELYIRCDDFDNASQAIAQLKKSEDSAAKVAYLQGLMARRQGDTLKAIKLWYKAAKAGLTYDQLDISLASALAGTGDINSAIVRLRNYTTRENYLPHANLMLAEFLAQTGKYAQAAEFTNKYLQEHPESLKAQLMLLGFQSRINSQYAEKPSMIPMEKLQENLLNKMQSSMISLTESIAAIGVSIENQNPDFARKMIDSLIKQHPSNQDVMLAELEVLTAENDTETAMTKLRQLPEKFPNSVKVMRYFTAFHIQQNDLGACEDVLSKCRLTAVSPDDARAIKMLLTEVYERSRQYDKAWAILKSLQKKDPSDITINRWLIAIAPGAEMTGQTQNLIDKIKAAEGPRGWQWRFEQAKLWFKSDSFKKHYEQIISYLMENLKNNPEDQPSRLLVAATYEKSGNIQLASSTYKQALIYSPDDIEITLAAVAAMHKAGEYNLAEQIIGKARSTGMTDKRLSALELNSHIRRGNYSSAGLIARKLSADDPDNMKLKLSLAMLNIRDKKFDQAGIALSELKKDNPDSVAVTAALVDLNIHLSAPGKAIADCNELLNKVSNANAYTLRGRTYMRIRNLSNAAEDLQTALHMNPEAIPTMILLARTYQSQGLSDKAVRLIANALEKAPDNFEAHKTAALIYLTSEDPDVTAKTTKVMEKALEINPDDIEMLMLKARVLFAKGTKTANRKAVKILRKATRLDPTYPQVWAILAEINLVRKDYIMAMDNIMTGLSYLPGNRLLYLSKARIEAAQNPQLAVETLTRLREKYPEDTDIAIYLAYMYINAGQSSAAVKLIRSLSADNSSTGNQKIQAALAEALYADGKITESMKIINSLYKSYPDSKTPFLAYVRILKSHNKWNELSEVVLKWYRDHDNNSRVAMAIIQQILNYENPPSVDCSEVILNGIIDEDYGNVDALNALGVLLHITGRSDQALKYYEKVLMIDPERIVAINNMAWILCEEQSKYDQALELTSTGLSKYPDYADLIDTAGVARYRLGQYEKSISEFKKCILLRKNTESAAASVHFHIARSLEKLGRFAEANEHLKKAIEINKLNGGLSSGQLTEVNMLLSEISERY